MQRVGERWGLNKRCLDFFIKHPMNHHLVWSHTEVPSKPNVFSISSHFTWTVCPASNWWNVQCDAFIVLQRLDVWHSCHNTCLVFCGSNFNCIFKLKLYLSEFICICICMCSYGFYLNLMCCHMDDMTSLQDVSKCSSKFSFVLHITWQFANYAFYTGKNQVCIYFGFHRE